MRQIPLDDMIAFMCSLPPSEHITQDVIRGAMERFGAKESAACRAYDAARATGTIEQEVEVRQARAYQGASQGCFCVPTRYYVWVIREATNA